MCGDGVRVVYRRTISDTIDGAICMPDIPPDADVSHLLLFRPARGSSGAVSGRLHGFAVMSLSFSKRPGTELIHKLLTRSCYHSHS